MNFNILSFAKFKGAAGYLTMLYLPATMELGV